MGGKYCVKKLNYEKNELQKARTSAKSAPLPGKVTKAKSERPAAKKEDVVCIFQI